MSTTCLPAIIVLSAGLVAVSAHAVGRPYLQVSRPLDDPRFTTTYDGRAYESSSHYSPQPGGVLKTTWADVHGTQGLMSAELGRLRVAEFGAARATAADGSRFGVGSVGLREVTFQDKLFLQGRGLNADTVMRVDYHFGGTAGGRIETNATGRLDIAAELGMRVGDRGVGVKEHTWATEDVRAGGQTRTLTASSGVFDVTATGFSMKLGPAQFGGYEFDLNWVLSVKALCLFSLSPLPVHLPAPSGGCSYSADYGNTASFMGLSLSDGVAGALLDPASYSLRSTSGFDYAQGFAPAVPEPQTWALVALGLGVVALRSRHLGSAEQRRVG